MNHDQIRNIYILLAVVIVGALWFFVSGSFGNRVQPQAQMIGVNNSPSLGRPCFFDPITGVGDCPPNVSGEIIQTSTGALECKLNRQIRKVVCQVNPKAPSSAISPHVAHCASERNMSGEGCSGSDASAICTFKPIELGGISFSSCVPKDVLEYSEVTRYCSSRFDSGTSKVNCEGRDQFSLERSFCRYKVYSNTDVRCEPAFTFDILPQQLGNWELQRAFSAVEARLKEFNNSSVELRNLLNRIHGRLLQLN